MGFYKYLHQNRESIDNRDYLIFWRKLPSIVRIERPSKIDRARTLGYKAKQGFVVVRIRIGKGMRKRPKPGMGRKPKKSGRYFSPGKSLQSIAEERVQKKFINMEILNSYLAGEDGKSKWFEVILIDRSHPAIIKDKDVGRIAFQKKRVLRGMTSAGKRGRGLMKKGEGSEKTRPSIRAKDRKGK
jgi:large subunit ribosomal protein L15e